MKLVRSNVGGFSGYNSFFDDLFTRDLFDHKQVSGEGTNLPSVNIWEDNDSFGIELAAPGLKKEDFKLKLDNNRLEISVENEKKENDEETSIKYSRKEFSYRNFSRSFNIPSVKIEMEKVGAEYENGILVVSLPKREEVKPKPSRMIEIA